MFGCPAASKGAAGALGAQVAGVLQLFYLFHQGVEVVQPQRLEPAGKWMSSRTFLPCSSSCKPHNIAWTSASLSFRSGPTQKQWKDCLLDVSATTRRRGAGGFQ